MIILENINIDWTPALSGFLRSHYEGSTFYSRTVKLLDIYGTATPQSKLRGEWEQSLLHLCYISSPTCPYHPSLVLPKSWLPHYCRNAKTELAAYSRLVNINVLTFSRELLYDRHVPKKMVRSDSRVPWMTNDLHSLNRTKKATFTKQRTFSLKCYCIKLYISNITYISTAGAQISPEILFELR